MNPDHLLFTLQDDRDISGELYVNKGRGYVEAELHPADRSLPVDLVRIDAIYNPVRRANFTVAETRVGQRTDYDRLTVTVETNGTISPEDAIAYAAALAQVHFQHFVDFGKRARAREVDGGAARRGRRRQPASSASAGSIDDFGLSVRSLNSLKNSNIRTLRDLVEFSEDDLLKVKNVGREGADRDRRSAAARRARTSGWRSRTPTATCGWSRAGYAAGAAARRGEREPVMRHRAKGRQLSRTATHQAAMLREHGRRACSPMAGS